MRNRSISVSEFLKKKFQLLPFEGTWRNSFGSPAICGSWIIWGQSGSGKTYFVLQLIKYLSQFSRILYNSLEEGNGPTMQKKFKEIGMGSIGRRLIVVCKSYHDLIEQLSKKKSPNIVFIESIQYFAINYREYISLKDMFPCKLFVIVSHADGKEPKGNTAKSIRYDAHIKSHVVGYKAFIASRYGGGEPFIIWEDGAKAYWAEEVVTKN